MTSGPGHGEIRFRGETCVRGCGRPARELGGHCTRCWMSLTGLERKLLTDEHGAPDGVLLALEAAWTLPDATRRGRAA